MKVTASGIQKGYFIGVAWLALVAWLSLSLAQKGWFSICVLIPLAILTLLCCVLVLRHLPDGNAGSAKPDEPWHVVVLLALVGCSGALFTRPHEYVEGGWDPGVYVNTAVNVAQTGSLTVHDEILPKLSRSDRSLFYHQRAMPQKYGGFPIIDEENGVVRPRFYNLYPALAAIPASFAGAKGALYVNPLFAMGTVIGIFLLGRALHSPAAGLLSAAILFLDPVQVWFSRFPTSEITAQFFLTAGLVAFLSYDKSDHPGHGFVSALCLGVALLTSASTVLVLVPALLLMFFCRRKRMIQGKDVVFLVTLCLLALHCAWQALFFNRVYLTYMTSRLYPRLRQTIPFLATPAVLTAVGMRIRYNSFTGQSTSSGKITIGLRVILVLGLVGLSAYAYFIWPEVGRGDNPANLRELCWFVTPLGLAIGVAGAGLAILKFRNEEVFPLALFLGSAVLFIYSKVLKPIYPWALRRYVTMVIPGLALYSGILFHTTITRLLSAGGRSLRSMRVRRTASALPLAILGILIGWKIASAPLLLTSTDYQGMTRSIEKIAKEIPEGLLVCEESWLATPLAFLHGKETLQVSDLRPFKCRKLEEVFVKWLNQGRDVSYIPLAEKPIGMSVDFDPQQPIEVTGTRLDRTQRHVPTRMRPFTREITVYRLRKAGEMAFRSGEAYRLDVGNANFGLGRGFHKPHLRDGKFIGRWTFRKAELFLPWPPEGNVELRIRMGGRPAAAPEARVRLHLADRLLDERTIARDHSTYSWRVTADEFPSEMPGRINLRIDSSTWNPSDYGISGYPPVLGVMLCWVEVARETPPSPPTS